MRTSTRCSSLSLLFSTLLPRWASAASASSLSPSKWLFRSSVYLRPPTPGCLSVAAKSRLSPRYSPFKTLNVPRIGTICAAHDGHAEPRGRRPPRGYSAAARKKRSHPKFEAASSTPKPERKVLSSALAKSVFMNVVPYLYQFTPSRLSAAGYAEFHPVAQSTSTVILNPISRTFAVASNFRHFCNHFPC
jgi:hypothetical protein